ncbi:MAG: hypothetical protein ABW219_01880 [Ilumatobacteraceae bacterium]
MNGDRRVGAAIGALVATVVVVVGVPLALGAMVGNPWPGQGRVEMGDEVAVLVGVLAVIGWLVWLRFVVALVVEVRTQLAELRLAARRAPTGRVVLAAPARSRAGVGLLAQRLVAAILILAPVAARVGPAVADGPGPLSGGRAPSALFVETSTGLMPVTAFRTAAAAPAGSAAPAAPVGSVIVGPGDTLIGLARQQLGDADRWREIYELNKDRPQADGARLVSPSALRVGWTLQLPAGGPVSEPASSPAADAPTGYLAPDTIVIELDDNLWDLSQARLEQAGLPADDAAVAAQVHQVIIDNPDVIEDPNVIFVGEQFAFPAVGIPPAEPVPTPAAPVTAPAVTAAELPPPVAGSVPTPAAAPVATPATVPASTSTTVPAPVPVDPAAATTELGASSPSPIGIGEATLLSAGVLALLAARRRHRLRASQPRARVPEPSAEAVAAERRLRSVHAGERLLRLDVAVRAAAATLVDTEAQVAVVRVGTDGVVELLLTGAAVMPAPWEGAGDRWELPGSTPVELLADAARSVGAPCVALTQLGVDTDGREVLVDLEALGVLSVVATDASADAVVRGIAATLATSIFAEVANLVGVGFDEDVFLGHHQAHAVSSVDGALELAATLVGSTATARQSTFVLRARHTSGEAWEPAIVLAASSVADEVTPELVRSAARRRGGLAVVVAGDAPGAPWTLRAGPGRWTLEPLGIELVPVGLTADEVAELHDVLGQADEPLIDEDVDVEPPVVPAADDGEAPRDTNDVPWSLLVRVLGPVEVVDRDGHAASFERSKTLELIAWLTLHRERSTRVGARTALWELDVRDATFANVVSEARRAMARLVEPPPGDEWLGRTLTEVLPLHAEVVTDADLVRCRLHRARLQPPELAIETLRPAVELIRDMPFAGTGYLWPDAEGITSNLVLLATSAATELAGHHLSMGDVDGVFWATGQGLKVLPGHEELIALRMRAHARAGDLSGVRLEWESYERVLNADPWSDGEPAPKLVLLRRQLLS